MNRIQTKAGEARCLARSHFNLMLWLHDLWLALFKLCFDTALTLLRDCSRTAM
jgi:hypothetical protein